MTEQSAPQPAPQPVHPWPDGWDVSVPDGTRRVYHIRVPVTHYRVYEVWDTTPEGALAQIDTPPRPEPIDDDDDHHTYDEDLSPEAVEITELTDRRCAVCGKVPLSQGYVIEGGDAYRCNDHPPADFDERHADPDSDTYWTMWDD